MKEVYELMDRPWILREMSGIIGMLRSLSRSFILMYGKKGRLRNLRRKKFGNWMR